MLCCGDHHPHTCVNEQKGWVRACTYLSCPQKDSLDICTLRRPKTGKLNDKEYMLFGPWTVAQINKGTLSLSLFGGWERCTGQAQEPWSGRICHRQIGMLCTFLSLLILIGRWNGECMSINVHVAVRETRERGNKTSTAYMLDVGLYL